MKAIIDCLEKGGKEFVVTWPSGIIKVLAKEAETIFALN